MTIFSCFGKQYRPCGKTQTEFGSKRQKKKLFSCVGCEYFNGMEIDVLDFDLIQAAKTSHYRESSDMFKKLAKKYSFQVLHFDLAPMYLKWISSDIGYGVFAKQNISKDDFVGVYAGELRLMRGVHDPVPEDVDYAWYYPINAPDGTRLLVDGKLKGNELRFINHDEHPNTKCIDVLANGRFYMCYIATKNIAKNTQITISYGDGYWNSRKINPENFKS